MLGLYLNSYGMNVNGRNYSDYNFDDKMSRDFAVLLKQGALAPNEIDIYKKYLKEDNIEMEEFHNYLHGTSVDLETDEKVQDALVKVISILNPNLDESSITCKLYKFIIH